MPNLTYEYLNEKQKEVVNFKDNCLLVTGAPGSGKTAVALLKANNFIENTPLKDYQKVLFLTFSQTAVFQLLSRSKLMDQKKIEIDTYHAFFLRLIQQFSKYIGFNPGKLLLMKKGERSKILEEVEGNNGRVAIAQANKRTNRLHFNEFCYYATEILKGSESIRNSIYQTYPLIIIDEFQDTSEEQWEFIKLIADKTCLICFAGPGQMIYRHLNADPDRLNHLCAWKETTHIELEKESFRDRSGYFMNLGNIILQDSSLGDFRNDSTKLELIPIENFYAKGNLLNGKFGVKLKWRVLNYLKQNQNKTVAILCYENEDCERVSECFSKKTEKGPKVSHRLIEDEEKMYYLEDLLIDCWLFVNNPSFKDINSTFKADVEFLLNHGERNLFNKQKLTDIQMLSFLNGIRNRSFEDLIREFCEEFGENKQKIDKLQKRVAKLIETFKAFEAHFEEQNGEKYKIFFLNKRVQEATKEKYSLYKGVQVMTLHKSKGREFDFVIIIHTDHDPFITKPNEIDSHRELWNVGITRTKEKSLIFYHKDKCCSIIKKIRKNDS